MSTEMSNVPSISSLRIEPSASLSDLRPVPRILPLLSELSPERHDPRKVNLACLTLSKLAHELGIATDQRFDDEGKRALGSAISDVLKSLEAGSTRIHEMAENYRKAECILRALLDLKQGIADLGGDRVAVSTCNLAEAEATVADGLSLYYVNLSTGERKALPVPASGVFSPAEGYVPFCEEGGNIQILDTSAHNALVPLPTGVRSLTLYRTKNGGLFATVSDHDPSVYDRGVQLKQQFISVSSKPGWAVRIRGESSTNPIPVSQSINHKGEVSLVYWDSQGARSVRRSFSLDYLAHTKVADKLSGRNISAPLIVRIQGIEREIAVCEGRNRSIGVYSLADGREIRAPKGRSLSKTNGSDQILGIELMQNGCAATCALVHYRSGSTEFWKLPEGSSQFKTAGLNFTVFHVVKDAAVTVDGEIFVVGHNHGKSSALWHSRFKHGIELPAGGIEAGAITVLGNSRCLLELCPSSQERGAASLMIADMPTRKLIPIVTPPEVTELQLLKTSRLGGEAPRQIVLMGTRGQNKVLIDVTDQCF